MKNVGVLALTILVALAATTYATSSTWGKISSRDRVIFSQRIFNYSSPYGIRRSVQFPAPRQTNKYTITAIQVTDNSPNKTNCYATLYSGGIGYKYSTVNFQCGSRGNLDFHKVIYGK